MKKGDLEVILGWLCSEYSDLQDQIIDLERKKNCLLSEAVARIEGSGRFIPFEKEVEQ